MIQLEDLPEPVLFKIIEYTNLQAKFNLMLTNKFFYDIIGRNPRFCKDFRLNFEGSSYPVELRDNNRFYSTVNFSNYYFNKENFAVILELFTKIGNYIKNIKFYFGGIERNHLYQLFRLIPNVEDVAVSFLKFKDSKEDGYPQCGHKFAKLKSLFLDTGFEDVFAHLFQDAKSLENLTVYHSFSIISNKPKLKSLRIGSNNQVDFDVILDNEDLKLMDLKIDNLDLNHGTAFENFKNFIETQKQIESFYFSYCDGPISEFSLILTHILNLETLRTVETGISDVFKYMPSDRIRNYNVKNLIIDRGMYFESNILAYYLKIFPGITSLRTHPYSLMEENILLLNNLSNLEELSIVSMIDGRVSKDSLESLQIPNLKKFTWSGYPMEYYENEQFEKFTTNNPKIVELTLDMGTWIGLEVLETIVKNLKDLKKLVITSLHHCNFELEDKIFEILGEHGKNLKYFEMDLGCKEDALRFIVRAAVFFEVILPDLSYKFYH